MMKKFLTNVLPWLIFVVCMLIFIHYMVRLAIVDYNSENPNNPLTNITSIVTCVIASTSLFVTINHSRKSQEHRKQERIQDIEYYWYKALIVDKFLPKIFSFFTLCQTELVDSLEKVNQRKIKGNLKHLQYMEMLRKEFTTPFTSSYTETQEEVITTAAIIDNELSMKLKEAFETFQDEFLKYSDQQNPDYLKMKQCVIEAQKNVITLIKTYNENIVS